MKVFGSETLLLKLIFDHRVRCAGVCVLILSARGLILPTCWSTGVQKFYSVIPQRYDKIHSFTALYSVLLLCNNTLKVWNAPNNSKISISNMYLFSTMGGLSQKCLTCSLTPVNPRMFYMCILSQYATDVHANKQPGFYVYPHIKCYHSIKHKILFINDKSLNFLTHFLCFFTVHTQAHTEILTVQEICPGINIYARMTGSEWCCCDIHVHTVSRTEQAFDPLRAPCFLHHACREGCMQTV